MENLLNQINLNKELSNRIIEALDNKRYSIQNISRKEELSILKTRLEISSKKNIDISDLEEIVSNLNNHNNDSIVRFIVIGKNVAFVLYLDNSKTIFLGYYESQLT